MSFYSELRRRNVFRVAIAYFAGAWLVLQVGDVVLPTVGAPGWAMLALIIAMSFGFPLAVLLAWVYDLTPEGIKATEAGDSPAPVRFIGRKLDFAIIGVLLLALGFLLADDWMTTDELRQKSIAVLPFENLSPDPEDSYFAAGVHEELVNALTRIDALRVIASGSVSNYADKRPPLAEIAASLDVGAVVRGSVRYAGERVRVIVQLIDTATESQLWSEAYEREFTIGNIFAIQQDISTAIADALEITLSPQVAERLGTVLTDNEEAWNFYQIALSYERAPGNHDLRILQYRRAVEADPDFAVAWAKLADAYSDEARYADTPEELARLRGAARNSAQRAVSLDADLAESHVAMGIIHNLDGDRDAALREYAIAEKLAPSNSWVLGQYAATLRNSGDYEAAIEKYAQAQKVEPLDSGGWTQQGELYAQLRQYALAEAAFEHALLLSPDDTGANPRMILLQEAEGDLEGMRAAVAHEALYRLRLERQWRVEFYKRDLTGALQILEQMKAVDVDGTNRGYGMTYKFLSAEPAKAIPYLEQERDNGRQDLSELVDDPAHPEYGGYLEVQLQLAETLGYLEQQDAAIELVDAVAGDPLIRVPSGRPEQGLHLRLIWALIAAQAYDRAIDELDSYLSSRAWWSLEGLELDPRFDVVTKQARYAELVAKYGRM